MRVDKLSAEKLSTGTKPGRITLFTQAAIEKVQKENLYKWIQKKQSKIQFQMKKP